MESETIMPDGRPLFAWENELNMLRAEQKEVKELTVRATNKMQLCGIVEAIKEQEIITGDILIRIKMSDMLRAKLPQDIFEQAEWKPLTKKGE